MAPSRPRFAQGMEAPTLMDWARVNKCLVVGISLPGGDYSLASCCLASPARPRVRSREM